MYKEFLKKYPIPKISYRFFCRARPFWVIQMKVQDRDTCKCKIHENMELLITSLYSNKIISSKTPTSLIADICCSYKNETCLFRLCNECKKSEVVFDETRGNDLILYFQWITLKEKYFEKKSKTVRESVKLTKQPLQATVSELISKIRSKLPDFMAHEARIVHQYSNLSDKKKSLQPNEILIHCDFSENYSLKYAEEIQSYHFGGARQQISMHTVVVYSNFENLGTTSKSFCTISESLEHNAAAIWAHLNPIIQAYCEKNIDSIHFLSDAPATQYRNKFMFSFFTNQLEIIFPQIRYSTWNFHEAGHGKGAPDGIGGVCKRSADRVVAQGKDISNFKTLIEVLRSSCPGVTFYEIKSDDIIRFANIIKSSKVIQFTGTMKVHQITTHCGSHKLWLRSLSCFKCDKFCSHYELGVICYDESKKTSLHGNSLSLRKPLCDQTNKIRFDEVYSSDSSEDNQASSSKPIPKIKTGVHVLVSISEKSSKKNLGETKYRYIAVCQSDVEIDGEIKVTFLKLCDNEKEQIFKLDEKDVSYINEEQILKVLPEPDLILKGNRVFYKFMKPVEIFERG